MNLNTKCYKMNSKPLCAYTITNLPHLATTITIIGCYASKSSYSSTNSLEQLFVILMPVLKTITPVFCTQDSLKEVEVL